MTDDSRVGTDIRALLIEILSAKEVTQTFFHAVGDDGEPEPYQSISLNSPNQAAAIAADLSKLLKQPVQVEPVADYPSLRRGLADKAYDNKRLRKFCRRAKIRCGIMHQARGKGELSRYKRGRNRLLKPLRAFVEGVPAVLKRFLRCGRAVYLGLERVTMQLDFGVMAFNLRRHAALYQERCA